MVVLTEPELQGRKNESGFAQTLQVKKKKLFFVFI